MEDNATRQTAAVVRIVETVLGESLVAIYRYGSSVMGGLRPYSDVDIFVIVDRVTTEEQRRRLTARVMEISGGRNRSIELTVVNRTVSWAEPRREYLYGEWLRDDYRAGLVPEPEIDPDLVILAATVLSASEPLHGPPARELLPPVSPDLLVASMREAYPALLDDLGSDANALLTLARMWHTVETGQVVRKDIAATWAAERVPEHLRAPLELARSWYVDGDTALFELSVAELSATANSIVGSAFPGSTEVFADH